MGRVVAALLLGLLPAATHAEPDELPDGFAQERLYLDSDAGEMGLYRVRSDTSGPFQALTRLDVAVLEEPVLDPEQWLLDRVAAETAAVAESALVLFDPDSPFFGARVNGAEPATPDMVQATLELVADSPDEFCLSPAESDSDAGLSIEVECTFWLGGISSHLLVRLQQVSESWYVILAQAQNSRRFRQLSAIADSLRF